MLQEMLPPNRNICKHWLKTNAEQNVAPANEAMQHAYATTGVVKAANFDKK
jgi:hypothetical protein